MTAPSPIPPRPQALSELERTARKLRATCIQMAFDGREGHLSSALSCVDVLVALYYGWLQVDPASPRALDRDRFLFSKGHAATALYAALADRGFIDKDLLATYAHNDTPLGNHPCRLSLPILEMSSGSLGHGLGTATGIAYGLRLDGNRARVVVLMSDGECNEGSVWEAAMFARAQRLDRVLAIVDNNGVQAVGRSDALMGHTSLEEKFRAFGWGARSVDGNDIAALQAALADVPFEAGKPTALIARTRGGAGVPFMEDQVLWHYRCPSADEVAEAFRILGEAPIHRAGAR